MPLQSIIISPAEINFCHETDFFLTYQTFGQPLGTAPIVLVNHALTGNSSVTEENGWWNLLIGYNKTINLKHYTVIAFDIPGNGFNGIQQQLIHDYKKFDTKTIALLFWKTLEKLNISQLFCVIGGSLGGAIAWEMAFIKPNAIELLIPIACNYKASDWLIGNVLVQDSILNHSSKPIEDARMHAMLLYRTPESLHEKFHQKYEKQTKTYQVESWLKHHGKKLKSRFELASYKLMNHLLKTIGQQVLEEDLENFAKQTSSIIHIVAVDSDYMFTAKEQFKTYQFIKKRHDKILFSNIQSIHGHDAFLIEYQQLHEILNRHFKS
ncbi:MAG TPA: alpha/beta fold hydrolase [Flavobacterium sp.]|nr:alpha/beta fold hydrolase [Flavobacterium sp.]